MSLTAKALIFDLNGTMINDMEYHAKGWYSILNEDLGANLSWEEVQGHMYGKNEELLVRIFGNERFTKDEMKELSMEKERRYQAAYLPLLKLIDGLEDFLAKMAARNIPLAIASAAIPFNIDFVLDNLGIRQYFKAIVSADDVAESKPHPETFLLAAKLLGVDAADCIVFEDAPKGVEAAMNAGMKTVVLTTMHEKESFSQYNNILQYVKDYSNKSTKLLFGI